MPPIAVGKSGKRRGPGARIQVGAAVDDRASDVGEDLLGEGVIPIAKDKIRPAPADLDAGTGTAALTALADRYGRHLHQRSTSGRARLCVSGAQCCLSSIAGA